MIGKGRVTRSCRLQPTELRDSGQSVPTSTIRAYWGLGFTLIELLVVVAVIGVLAGLLLPALAKARNAAKTSVCIGNQRQLTLAWHLYVEDQGGRFPWSAVLHYSDGSVPAEELQSVWCRGVMSYSLFDPPSDRTNLALLTAPAPGSLGGYTRNPLIYRCPSDSTPAFPERRRDRSIRVRSYSMNRNFGFPQERVRDISVIHREADLRRHAGGPAGLSLFWDESEGSIDDTGFGDPTIHPNEYVLEGVPSTRHRNAGTVSFVDGHVEVHRWTDPKLIANSHRVEVGLHTAMAPGSPDFIWIVNAMRTVGPGTSD